MAWTLPWYQPGQPQAVQTTGPLGVAAAPPGLPTGPWGGAIQKPVYHSQGMYAMTVAMAVAYPVIQIARTPADSFAPGVPPPGAVQRAVGPPAIVAPSNSMTDGSPGVMLAGEPPLLAAITQDVPRRETSVT